MFIPVSHHGALRSYICAGALLVAGPPCCTWVFLSRGTTRRDIAYPLGRQDLPSVAEANLVVSRLVMLVLSLVASIVYVCSFDLYEYE